MRPFAFVILIALATSACYHVVIETGPTAETVNAHPANGLRVITVDGTQMDIEKPHISSDTLFGIVRGGSNGDRAVAIPLAEVRSVAVKRIDGARTAILLGAIGVSAVWIAVFITLAHFLRAFEV